MRFTTPRTSESSRRGLFHPRSENAFAHRQTRQTKAPYVYPPRTGLDMHSHGTPLPSPARSMFEARFGHDFGNVRIHTDAGAAQAARLFEASAFTVGQDIVFASGRYRPTTPEGQRLLAHELTHVVQNAAAPNFSGALSAPGDAGEVEADRAATRVSSGLQARVQPVQACAQVQRQNDTTLTLPPFGTPKREYRLFPPGQEPSLHLDPWVQAYTLLDPDMIQRNLLNVDLGVSAPLTLSPLQSPATPPTTPAPPVPQGQGPATPRGASAGDVLSALAAVPAVKAEITRLRNLATDRLQHDWKTLSTGGKAVAIGGTALVVGGALAAILSNNAGRQFALQQIQGKAIPVPFVPGLSVQVNPIGPNQSVLLNLDLAAMAKTLGIGGK